MGFQAGFDNTTGFNNTIVGLNSGAENTIGNDNAFFGNRAGLLNTTGDSNSFLGSNAGFNNLTGTANTFVGFLSGSNNTSGDFNAFVGRSAGDSNTTGSSNSAFGNLADVGSGNLSNATAIGAGAIVTANDTIQLGRNGVDTVRIGTTGTAGSTSLCLNANNEISTCSSSMRYKTDVRNFSPGLNLIKKLRPVSFNWKEGGMFDLGLVAEEVNQAEPLLTVTTKDGRVEGVKYDRIGVVLVNAVQEQQEQIEKQAKANEALKTQVEKQRQLIKDQQIKLQKQEKQMEKQKAELEALKEIICASNSEAKICR